MQTVATSIDYSKDTFKELCFLDAIAEKSGQIIIPIGMRSDGLVQEDFSKIPSSLIVGTTGSGKSAFVKTALSELMEKYTPDQIRFAIYDSRRVDYNFLNSNPYMLVPIINDPTKIKGLIQWSLMEARKRMNSLDHIEELPHIFVIMDDFGEMSPSNDTFSDLIQLFQIARRTRLHFWLVTSTPSSNVLPTDLKANINHRIAFRASSRSISRIFLDDVGAETLSVPGEIIVKLNNETIKCNAVYLDDSDIETLSKNAVIKYPNTATEVSPGSNVILGENRTGSDYFLGEDGRDVLYKQAVEVVLDTKQASVSMIQRRLKLGYARAARIVDQMENDGVVGPFEGSNPRVILVTRDQWNKQQSGYTDTSKKHTELSHASETKEYSPAKTQSVTLTAQKVSLRTGYSISAVESSIVINCAGEEVSIAGEDITDLFFKKPGIFRKGTLSVVFTISNSIGSKQPTDKERIDIPFDSKDVNSLKQFCKQLSGDVKKPFVEL